MLRCYRVPPGEFYLLGDNRADSCDSRYWGPIKGSSIVGKVVLTFWHDDHRLPQVLILAADV